MSKFMQPKITRYLEKQDGEMCNDNSNVRPRLYQCHDYDNSNRLSCDPTSTCSGERLSGFSSRDSEVIMSFHGVGCSKHDEVAQCCKWSQVFLWNYKDGLELVTSSHKLTYQVWSCTVSGTQQIEYQSSYQGFRLEQNRTSGYTCHHLFTAQINPMIQLWSMLIQEIALEVIVPLCCISHIASLLTVIARLWKCCTRTSWHLLEHPLPELHMSELILEAEVWRAGFNRWMDTDSCEC